jgi:small redox-active disulfide protein 2
MEIKILGKGCPKCKRVEQIARQAAKEVGVDATFIKIKNIEDIMTYPIISTPGLVINEKLVSSGHIPSKDEVIDWIKTASLSKEEKNE